VNDSINILPQPWRRVFELAPNVVDIFHSQKWDPKHALLFTLLHASDRKRAVDKGREAILRTCAWIVAYHQYSHDPYSRNAAEQLYYLSRSQLPDEDDRLFALECYIDTTCDETGKEVERDLEAIIACAECIEWWRTAPQRRRARIAAGTIYQPRTVKPRRRTKADIEDLKNAVYKMVEAEQPMTVRQVFYQMVAKRIVNKDEHEYKNTACALLLRMRRDGELPYSWIADNTRYMRKPPTFNSLQDALADCAATYRRAVWHDLLVYVELWVEKDALAGVIAEETYPYDVPLMVARGFGSETYLHSAGEYLSEVRKPAYIYHFGDHDPSGVKSAADIERKLRGFAPDAEIHFEHVAVTPEQIAAMNLPTRPTKREGNSHAKNFDGDSVDLDAIPASELRRLARECIERHIPAGHIEALEVAEQSEREILEQIAGARNGTP
jgi:hypothetical protein